MPVLLIIIINILYFTLGYYCKPTCLKSHSLYVYVVCTGLWGYHKI